MSLTIDAHQHFWQRSLPFDYRWLESAANAPICRDFLPEHLEPYLRAAGVDYTIFVQTQHNLEENRWALGLAERYPWIAGVVGWIDLSSPACEDQLLEMRKNPRFIGVRHITQDEPDDDFILRPEIVRGLKVLEKHQVPFDLLFYRKHLKHAPTLARLLPGLPMVIDHLSKPQIRTNGFADWLPLLQAAAKFPNLYCKLSGLVTEADWKQWKPADLKPYIDATLDAFGPSRCMFGSDWPVCELAGSYSKVYSSLVESLGQLSRSETTAVLGGTACQFYQLKVPSK